ncbi:N-acetylneuraminate synthase [Thalassospira sp. GO-4]|jgi:N-acetylneuraminate synthase/N,N'-diacetyllegionaminate synthase|uniref:N-acetylneuraminate synthase n=1 Tax=Thalassospira sp. GO-4 TaxID=2946605 RepID=UPI0020241A6E|nr:N-acetylneuraminate synthase [Thalassospira sp. GO-4]URK17333.1 N-acetylneuraminate synthase [Thalassospira sp. GO-4]
MKFSVCGMTRCFIIAEAGVNHNGDIEHAHRLIDIAADAEADAVKFQTFTAEELVSVGARRAKYQVDNEPEAVGETQFDMLKRLELPREAYPQLIKHCSERGILFLSTPFEEESADFLHSLDLPLFKVSSGELTNLPFLEYLAKKQRPMILSTGMANWLEIDAAVELVTLAGNNDISLLHCTSSYPTPVKDANLLAMREMMERYSCPIGYSDHTLGEIVPLASVAMGAKVLEKHITIDRGLRGPDHLVSMEPDEFKNLVYNVRQVELAMGRRDKVLMDVEVETLAAARKSVFAKKDISTGQLLTLDDLTCKRPGTGISPSLLQEIVGQRALLRIPTGTQLTWSMISNDDQ